MTSRNGPPVSRRFRAAFARTVYALVAVIICTAGPVHADRVVLSPSGNVLAPLSFKAEAAVGTNRAEENFAWLQYATNQGIEIEAQRYGPYLGQPGRFSLNVQYPILYDIGRLPGLSVGMRDLLRTGAEHRALYGALTKTLPLSDRQAKVLREFRLNAGVGTERMTGIFIGATAQFRTGMLAQAEYYRNRANLSVAFPFARNFQARAYSLNGRFFYGLSYSLNR